MPSITTFGLLRPANARAPLASLALPAGRVSLHYVTGIRPLRDFSGNSCSCPVLPGNCGADVLWGCHNSLPRSDLPASCNRSRPRHAHRTPSSTPPARLPTFAGRYREQPDRPTWSSRTRAHAAGTALGSGYPRNQESALFSLRRGPGVPSGGQPERPAPRGANATRCRPGSYSRSVFRNPRRTLSGSSAATACCRPASALKSSW